MGRQPDCVVHFCIFLVRNLGAEILLAVAGIGSEALQEAIATGAAQLHQGSTPNTFQISLPMNQSLRSTVTNTDLEDGDEMQTRIIHLPISNEVLTP